MHPFILLGANMVPMSTTDLDPGPWHDEPDRLEWLDTATGLPCAVNRGTLGALSGYVGVPEGHPAFGRGYDLVDVLVHGGLTFAKQIGDYWVLGFDCAHYMDYAPRVEQSMSAAGIPPRLGIFGIPEQTYRTILYVQREVTDLAAQLHEMEPSNAPEH